MARVNGLASMSLACAAWRAKEAGMPVIGIDLAGAEAAAGGVGGARHHVAAFEWARQHYLSRTVHAGEALGAESIREAVMSLQAQRIGHGFALFAKDEVGSSALRHNTYGDVDARAVPRYDVGVVSARAAAPAATSTTTPTKGAADASLSSPSSPPSLSALSAAVDSERCDSPLSTALRRARASVSADEAAGAGGAASVVRAPPALDEVQRKAKYVDDLAEEIGKSALCIEVCLSSNVGTMPILEGGAALHKHALGDMLAKRLRVSLCTDNTLVSNTSVTREYELAIATWSLDRAQVKSIAVDGIRSSFFPGTFAAKREYIKKWVAMYGRAEMAAFGNVEQGFTYI